jgi:hypothetical protein
MTTKDQLRIGDRVEYLEHAGGRQYRYVMEVVKLEDRGAVCDLLQARGDGTWLNIGHRCLLPYAQLNRL